MVSSQNSNLHFLLEHKEFGNSIRVLLLTVLIIYTLTNNDGVLELAVIFLSNIRAFDLGKKTQRNIITWYVFQEN